GHWGLVVIVVFRGVSILSLVLIANLRSELECGKVCPEMVVDSHGRASLQVELCCLSEREVNRVQVILRRVEDWITRHVAGVLRPILAWPRDKIAVVPNCAHV